jgi:DNA mismatch endonuclease (patch repair protein)
MADIVPPNIRSRIMASVKSRDTKPELEVRRALHAAGFRYRLHSRDLPGRPDIALPRFKVAVFVHGCFWHGHKCARGRPPA